MFKLKSVMSRAAVSVGAALVGTAVALVATGTPAQAATPKCNAAGTQMTLRGVLLDLPVYRTGSSTTVLCGVYEGDSGDDVNQLQWTLIYCYSENLKQDGKFGTKTKAALVRAQGREHVKADGSYGPNTALALLHPQLGPGGCGKL
ncbi:peptidoglycan-binding protein [Dactylosporangium sp. NPDC051541]|uniref:peptidoglycan-binding protein n=1 Tax=Dactylosporangium sp. NPDC051541 TaxID=3363977 RepID=UPI00378A7932